MRSQGRVWKAEGDIGACNCRLAKIDVQVEKDIVETVGISIYCFMINHPTT